MTLTDVRCRPWTEREWSRSPSSLTVGTMIGITGASGHIGGACAATLQAEEGTVRLVLRDPSRAPEGDFQIRRAEYGDFDAAVAALDGVSVLLMVSAAENAQRLHQHRTFIDAAAAAGVQHVVYTSFLGAGPDATFTLARDHWATEEHLRATPMAWTFLRDSFYLDFLPTTAGDDGVIRGPAGSGKVGAVARADVARCALAVLRDPGAHAGAVYQLTGPQSLSFEDVARIVTEVTGRPTRYEDQTVAQAYETRRPYGVPQWQLDAWVSTYTAIAAGELDLVTGDVQRLTGSPPVSLAQLLAG